MVSLPLSQRPTPESGGRSRRCRSPASIAERSVAPSASAPISVIAGFIQSLERPRSAQPPVGAGTGDPPAGRPRVGASASQPRVGAAAGEVGAGTDPSTAAQVGAAAGEVGAGTDPSSAVPDHSVAAVGEVGIAGGGGDRRRTYF